MPVASAPREDEQEAEELPPRAYRASPTAIVRAMVLRTSPQLVQTATAVYADGTANTTTLLLEPHVALTLGLAWRQLLPGPLAEGTQPTVPSESPVREIRPMLFAETHVRVRVRGKGSIEG